jgi:hypothetical protein
LELALTLIGMNLNGNVDNPRAIATQIVANFSHVPSESRCSSSNFEESETSEDRLLRVFEQIPVSLLCKYSTRLFPLIVHARMPNLLNWCLHAIPNFDQVVDPCGLTALDHANLTNWENGMDVILTSSFRSSPIKVTVSCQTEAPSMVATSMRPTDICASNSNSELPKSWAGNPSSTSVVSSLTGFHIHDRMTGLFRISGARVIALLIFISIVFANFIRRVPEAAETIGFWAKKLPIRQASFRNVVGSSPDHALRWTKDVENVWGSTDGGEIIEVEHVFEFGRGWRFYIS